MKLDLLNIFNQLFFAHSENEVNELFKKYPSIFDKKENWFPLGGNESNFGVIENQQASPIAALIEKITNSIDAIMLKKCLESGIDPKSSNAPSSMDEAIKLFFPLERRNWNLNESKQKQAEEIQILADGLKLNPSLTIYDNGEGQHPFDFEKTFLSLLRGNKNEIQFVQGKYNMGGTGALVFCGKNRYQLIASRRFDKTGDFGFTLVRKHPLSEEESKHKKNTWYEFIKIDGEIPSFPITSLDLNLKSRQFTSGTIIKLYSYDLPSGSRSVISRDLNQSINEFLFEPALPVYTIDRPERYPDDKNLARELFGLKRRLEQDNSKYVEVHFSEESESHDIGKTKITCYIFRNKIEGKNVKESKDSIEREFFKNNMAVLFSLNGQVHGHYTNEFITRTLKMPLLKDHLLIHVDCTHMNYEFRGELFMASRDRLKDGEQSRMLRKEVGDILSKGHLKEVYKKRKDSISMESGETTDLLKSLSKSLPLNSDLLKLLKETFKLEENKSQTGSSSKGKIRKIDASGNLESDDSEQEKDESQQATFSGKRFPAFFKLKNEPKEGMPASKIPLGGKRMIKFSTDVENDYFDRTDDPGNIKLSLLNFKPNETTGGTKPGTPKELSDLMNITKSSPDSGTIRVSLSPTNELKVDDLLEIKATLESPSGDFDECFWVKIITEEKQKPVAKSEDEIKQESIGLPPPVLVYREKKDPHKSWEDLESAGIQFEFETIMHPYVEGDILERIYINMDSSVLKNYKSKFKTITHEQIETAEKKYITSVYFHTLFLFTISKRKNYSIHQGEKESDFGEYLKDVFASYYSEFLLNFGMENLMSALEV